MVYDEAGNRVSQIVHEGATWISGKHYFNSGKEVREGSDGPMTFYNLAGVGRVSYPNGSSGHKEYYLKDHLGTTREIYDLNSNKMTYSTHSYPYGKALRESRTASQDVTQKFTTKELDQGIDLTYFGAKYYDQDLGVWTSPDAARQYHDLYSYTAGHPINAFDPDGNYDVVLTDQGNTSIENSPLLGLQHVYADVGGNRYETNGAFTMFNASANQLRLISFSERAGTNVSFFPAWSGNSSSDPLPIGDYTFNKGGIQRYGDLTALQKAVAPLGMGPWPSSTRSWGEARAWLTPSASTRQNILAAGRNPSSFSIHGGTVPGSRGCIDLCGRVNGYFNKVPSGTHPVFSR